MITDYILLLLFRSVVLNRYVVTHFWVAGTHFWVAKTCIILVLYYYMERQTVLYSVLWVSTLQPSNVENHWFRCQGSVVLLEHPRGAWFTGQIIEWQIGTERDWDYFVEDVVIAKQFLNLEWKYCSYLLINDI